MYEDGEIDRLVRTIKHDETNDVVIKKVMFKFKEQPVGIQNKFLILLTKQLEYYGKQDIKNLFKNSKAPTTSKGKAEIELDEDEIKPYLLIGDEIMNKFHIITLKDVQISKKPVIMVFRNYSYRMDLCDIEKYISNRIVSLNVSHKYTFNDVIHYISKQTLFDPEKLNYDGLIMIFQNGIYDFKKDHFIQDNEAWEKYYFYELPHNYKNEKVYDCPKFKKALIKWVDKKTNKGYRKGKRNLLINDIFEGIGLCMTMNMGFRTSFLNHGPPRCGKTQFFNIVCFIIGRMNRSNTSLQRLSKNQFGAERIEFKILNYCGDLPSSDIMDTGLWKSITGGDIGVEGERKGGEQHEIQPVCKFWFNANLVPKLGKWNDEAAYDRFIMIPFLNQFEMLDNDTIENFYNLIINDPNEVQGIIHKAIEGYKRLLKRGGFRAILRKDTQHTWNYASNPFYAFLHDFCKKEGKGRIQVDEFQTFFTESYPGTSKNAITRGLYELGIAKKQGRIGNGNNKRTEFYFGVDWKVKSEEVGYEGLDIDKLFENEDKPKRNIDLFTEIENDIKKEKEKRGYD